MTKQQKERVTALLQERVDILELPGSSKADEIYLRGMIRGLHEVGITVEIQNDNNVIVY